MKKYPLQLRILFGTGLLLVILPIVFREYIVLPDALKGLLVGVGLGLEIIATIKMKRFQKRVSG